MPKVSESADLSGYAPVATRINAFYERYPDGRIITQLWERTQEEVVFRALVYRYQGDSKPAATGWASEREGDGDINLVACLENTETSAIGRALANLGFTASVQRASAEEMAKASRARVRLAESTARSTPRPQRPPVQRAPSDRALPERDNEARNRLVADLLRLVQRAAHAGVRPARIRRWRARLMAGTYSERDLARMEQRLRRWITSRDRVATG